MCRLQSTITEEARIAYNSLVENPCSSSAVGVGSGTLGGGSSFSSSTLPRAKLTNSLSLATASFRFKDIDCCSPPSEQAPKSPPEEVLDLLLDEPPPPPAIEAGSSGAFESNPLRMLRSRNFPIVPRAKSSGKFSAHATLLTPEEPTDVVGNHCGESAVVPGTVEYPHGRPGPPAEADGANNPIPLPPRDRNKTIPVNQKRHVRKYPLIIPATGVQRTLNKVTQITPVEEKTLDDVFAAAGAAAGGGEAVPPGTGEVVSVVDQQELCNLDVLHKSLESLKLGEIHPDPAVAGGGTMSVDLPAHASEHFALKHGYSKEFLENNFPNVCPELAALGSISGPAGEGRTASTSTGTTTTLPATIPAASAILTRRRTASDTSGVGASHTPRRYPPPPPPPASLTLAAATARDPTYENLDIFQTHNQFCIDTASLHCESILENDTESCSPVPEAISSAAEDVTDGFANASALFETGCGGGGGGGADKPGGPATPEQPPPPCPVGDGELKKSMNFVSCEDLLEFAEKPKGRARGLESDEVRIMSKVLGKKPSPEQCLLTLEFIDWDIHKAIKLCKLQTILESYSLSLPECRDALQMYEWDLHTTAIKLKGGGSGGGVNAAGSGSTSSR